MSIIKSGLRPEMAHSTSPMTTERLIHEDYDSFFRALSASEWAYECDGGVESPVGWFARVSIEYAECDKVWEEFVNEDTFTESQLLGMWAGHLAGHYVITIDSQGVIVVVAFDDSDAAQRNYTGLVERYDAWLLAG